MLSQTAYASAYDSILHFLEQSGPLLENEKWLFRNGEFVVRAINAQKDLIHRDELLLSSSQYVMFLVDGFAYDYRITKEGRRQITAFHVAGSFCNLASMYLGDSDFTVATLTDATIAFIPKHLLVQWGRHHHGLGQLLARAALTEASVAREWLVNVGHRSAFQRTAHLLCELASRMEAAGLPGGPDYELPMTQLDLADALGLTPVHLSRTLQWLRGEGLVELADGALTIPSRAELEQAADFNPGYLHLGTSSGLRASEAMWS